MNARKYLVGVAAGALLLAGTVVTSYAADPTPTTQPSTAYCQENGGGRWGGQFPVLDTVAKLLGVQPADIQAARQDGKSLTAIAQEKGVAQDKLIDTILEAKDAALDAKVKDGTITQERADLMLERMESQVKTAVERTTVGPMRSANGEGAGMGQRGRMGRGFGAGATR